MAIGLLWVLLLTSAVKQVELSWQYWLIIGRSFTAVMAFILGIQALIKLKKNTFIFYSSICALIQCSFACLEPASSIEFYEYIAYIYLISALSFNGELKDWFGKYFIVNTAAIIIPLFFKDLGVNNIGDFVFRFTTTVTILFISTLVVNINAKKFNALKENLKLKNKLIDIEKQKKAYIGKELSLAKEELKGFAKKEAQLELATKLSHDIRGPISFIKCYLSSGKSDTAPVIGALDDITLIAEDLMYKRKLQNISTVFEFSDILIQTVKEFEMMYPKVLFMYKEDIDKDLKFEVTSRLSLPEFKRIMGNLIRNSVEAVEGLVNPEVSIRIGFTDQGITTSVSDNGETQAKDYINKIGRKGFTFGKKDTGYGYGVYYAKKTLEEAGGHIEYSANASHGLTAKVVC